MSLTDAMTRIAAVRDARRRAAEAEGTRPPSVVPRAGKPRTATSASRGVRAEPSPGPVVFVSYAMPDDEELAAALEKALTARGYSVWRAAGLVGGETPHRAIAEALAAARAAIVVWTPASIHLDWVYSEARRAWRSGKLIPVRDAGIGHDEVPPPFDTVQTLLNDDLDAIALALLRLGIEPRPS